MYTSHPNQVKLRRLIKYMTLKDVKIAAVKGSTLEEDDQMDTGVYPLDLLIYLYSGETWGILD